MFRLLLPRSLGGDEIDLVTMAEVTRIIAAADASTAWCLGQGGGCAMTAALLAPEAAKRLFGAPDAVLAWAGPYEAPQDFTLPGLWIEVKAALPSARTVRITSADQLAAAGPLHLAVVTLSTLLPSDAGVSAAGLIEDLERQIPGGRSGEMGVELGRRLSAVGYDAGADYARLPFRIESTHYYEVGPDFPRLTPEDLDAGIAEVRYDLELGALAQFATPSPLEA